MALDIAFDQCLVYYEDDAIPWHHRILLLRGPEQRWVWLTPDREVQLQERRVLVAQHQRGEGAYLLMIILIIESLLIRLIEQLFPIWREHLEKECL